MDSYVVRIYRRNIGTGKEVGGLVERVCNGKRQAFRNSEELWAFLTRDRPSKRRKEQAGPG